MGLNLSQFNNSLPNANQGQKALEQQQRKQILDQELQTSPFQSNADQSSENLPLPSEGLLHARRGPSATQDHAQQVAREVQSRDTPCSHAAPSPGTPKVRGAGGSAAQPGLLRLSPSTSVHTLSSRPNSPLHLV